MEFVYGKNESGIDTITALGYGGQQLGRLSHWNEFTNNTSRLNSISVEEDYQGRGLGTELVRRFVNQIGPDRRVSSGITNVETFEELYKSGILQEAKLHSELPLIGTLSLLNRLPVIRTFTNGGIDTQSLTIINGANIACDLEEAKKSLDECKQRNGYFYGLFWIEFMGRTRC